MKPDFEMRVPVSKRSRAWESLRGEIPAGADLENAVLVLTPSRVSASLRYRRVKPDGTPHQRPSTHEITLDPTAAGTGPLLREAFGTGKHTDAFLNLLPAEYAAS